ncbi:AI-2E family transporter [Bacillus massiliigorillae]|uniref:AI-2E family transporter n=1 Tax=Bacillus massiliigorillae TaxID=1243664 RepID=UPI00039AAB05|nr:AI-2E family transporter [Bacillus massiliigorillae]
MKLSMMWFYRLGFLLLLFIVILVFFKLKPIWLPVIEIIGISLLPFVLAAFITYLLHPVVEKLHKRGCPRSISILVIYLLFFGGLGFAIYKGIPVIIHELDDLMKSTPYFADKYTSLVESINQKTSNWPVEYKGRIEEGILFFEKKVEALLANMMNYLVRLFDYVIIFAIVPLIAFYFLKDWETMKRAAWYITPARIRKQSKAFLLDVEQSLGNYIRGQIIVCLIIGAISALLLWLIKVKYSLLLGIIIGITNVIPYFGPIIGAVPAIIIAAATNPNHVIWVAVIVFGLQFVEGNILSPLIVGKSLHMHPLLIMLSLFIGGEVSGVIGLIIAVPILAILKVAIIHAKVHFMKERHGR